MNFFARLFLLWFLGACLSSAEEASNNEKRSQTIAQEFFDFEDEVKDIVVLNPFNISSLKQHDNPTIEITVQNFTMDKADIETVPPNKDVDAEASESNFYVLNSNVSPETFIDRRSSTYDDAYEYEYDEYDGGYEKEHRSGYDEGYLVERKKPGPYGPPTPNFECEKTSETLYVSEAQMTVEKKCYTVYKVQCTEGVDEGKTVGYQKHCNEFTETRCRTVYDTSSEEKCWTVYKKKCEMIYETIQDWEYKQKCTTSYEEECRGYGYHKQCKNIPKEHCKQVPKKVEKSVPRTKCRQVPDKRCQDFPINVPRKECKEFPKTVCTQDPINVPKKIPKKTCVQIPREVCNKIPKVIIKDVPKKVGKKVCHSTKHSYEDHSYEKPHGEYGAPSRNTHEEYGAPPRNVHESYGAPPQGAHDDYGAPEHKASNSYESPPSTSYSAPSDYGTRTASAYGYKRSH